MLVDQFGNAYPTSNGRHFKSATTHIGVPKTRDAMMDIDQLLPPYNWRLMTSTSRSLYNNNGVIKGAINQISNYAVGKGYDSVYRGQDAEYGAKLKKWLKGYYKGCNVRGGAFNFKKSLELVSTLIDKDGDCFIVFTKSPNGYPQIQILESHRVGQRGSTTHVESGTYKGKKLSNGAIVDKTGRTIAFRVLGATPEQDKDVSTRSMMQVFDPESPSQYRGICVFAHALNDFKSMTVSSDYELHAQLIMSSIATVEHNEEGEPNTEDLYNGTTGNGTSLQYTESGTQKYFTAGSGSKIETLTNDRPSANWREYHDRLTRNALVGIGWSSELLIQASTNSVANRLEMQKATKTINKRRELLDGVAAKIIFYGISVAIVDGFLPETEEPFNITFTVDKALSIDLGHDCKADLASYAAGTKNLTDILEPLGKTVSDHLYERAEEECLAIKIKEEIELRDSVSIDSRKMRMLTPNEAQEEEGQGSQATESREDQQDLEFNVSNDDELDFLNLKSKFDAYGVAVRAGAITPEFEDEISFREEAGLPEMSNAVKEAWKKDGGYRRPITLLINEDEE